MADQKTPERGFTLPELGASKDSWGAKINSNFSAIDVILSKTTGDFMPRAGGEFTGTAKFSGVVEAAGNPVSSWFTSQQPGGSFYFRRKSDNLTTHQVADADIANPDVANTDRSFLTRVMADNRYPKTNAENALGFWVKRPGGGITYLSHSDAVAFQAGGVGQEKLLYLFRGVSATNADIFRIAANGNVMNANNAYGGLSDGRLKENVVNATPQLDDVLALRVVNFNFIDSDVGKQIGLIAQEVRKIKPGLVETDEDGYLSVKYSILVPILVKAVQELNAKIEQLSKR